MSYIQNIGKVQKKIPLKWPLVLFDDNSHEGGETGLKI